MITCVDTTVFYCVCQFKSDNKKIAKVSKKGVVKGKKFGTTKVTVISKKNTKKKKSISIKVVKPVKSVGINEKQVFLGEGATLRLHESVAGPKGSFKKVKWVSSDESVATVTKDGGIVAIKAGVVTITAIALDGTN